MSDIKGEGEGGVVEEVAEKSPKQVEENEEKPSESTKKSEKSETSENTKKSEKSEGNKKSERSESKSSYSKRKSSSDNRSSSSTSKRTRKDVQSEVRPPSTRRIYIANVSYDAKWQEIKDLFRDKLKDCEYVHLFDDDDGKPRGCGIVEFKDPNTVKKALDLMDKYEFKGRKFVVKEDFDSQRDHTGRIIKGDLSTSRSRSSNGSGRGIDSDMDSYRHGSQRMNSNDNSGSGGNKWGNTYGLSPQFLESLGINSPLTNRVFVANLDYRVSIKKLREIFKLAGSVQNINLNTDKDGNSKGHGVVIFEHPVEAVQAVSMFHNQLLNDRAMTVKIDRISESEEAAAAAPKLPRGLKSIGLGLGANGMPLTNVAGALVYDKRDVMAPAPTGNWVGPSGNDLGVRGGSFPDRGNYSDMRSGGFSGGNMGAGGFPDRMSSSLSSGMGNSFSDRAGILGSYERNAYTTQGYSDRGMSGNGSSVAGFVDRGNALAGSNFDRGFGSTGSSYSDRSSSVRTVGATLAGNVPVVSSYSGAGIMGAGGDSGRFDDYRRDYSRGNYATTTTPIVQENDYRTYGEEQALPRYSGPVSSTIIVRNLPVHYSKLDLMDRFLEAGKIEFTKVSGDGLGLVCYSSEREAQRAINIFDGSRLDGRVLEVAFR